MFNATITKTIPALKPFQSMNKVPKLNFTVDLRETLQTLKTRAPKSARNPQKITSYNKSDIFESMKNHEVTLLKNINPEHSFKMVDISSFQSKAPRDVPNNYVNLTEKKETNEKLSPSFDFDPDRVYNRKRMSLKKFEYSIL